MSASKIISVDFEVFGKVQGVFFRKYTQEQGKNLGLKGWCMNTKGGTVLGVMEGEPRQVEAMKKWLQETGSPQSKIERTVFKNERDVEKYSFNGFSVHGDSCLHNKCYLMFYLLCTIFGTFKVGDYIDQPFVGFSTFLSIPLLQYFKVFLNIV